MQFVDTKADGDKKNTVLHAQRGIYLQFYSFVQRGTKEIENQKI